MSNQQQSSESSSRQYWGQGAWAVIAGLFASDIMRVNRIAEPPRSDSFLKALLQPKSWIRALVPLVAGWGGWELAGRLRQKPAENQTVTPEEAAPYPLPTSATSELRGHNTVIDSTHQGRIESPEKQKSI